jgi:Histidine kinase-, DNA gyrase B-, and HSP90-like ATPase
LEEVQKEVIVPPQPFHNSIQSSEKTVFVMLRLLRGSSAAGAAKAVMKNKGTFPSRNVTRNNVSMKKISLPHLSSTSRCFCASTTPTPTPAAESKPVNAETREFQAETRKLLDIVTNSIYTDKEVFVRELISNASDALEKFRYKQVLGSAIADGDNSSGPLEINIVTDTENSCLILTDNGIGMSREELISNLGTIARSGSKQFVESLKTSTGEGTAATGPGSNGDGIIGQFGVGFYSSFMVSESVTVESMPAAAVDADGNVVKMVPSKWSSDGSGQFTIEESPESELKDTGRGSRIVMKLKESCKEYANEEKIKR